MNVHIRWMIPRDMPEVLAIEAESFEFPWTEKDFIHHLRQKNCIGMVAEYDDQIAGFMVYELTKRTVSILDLAAGKAFRHQGIGAQLIEKLKSKLSAERRSRLTVLIEESAVRAQVWLRHHGFVCVAILRGYYEGPDEESSDAYKMVYRHGQQQSAGVWRGTNRISSLLRKEEADA